MQMGCLKRTLDPFVVPVQLHWGLTPGPLYFSSAGNGSKGPPNPSKPSTRTMCIRKLFVNAESHSSLTMQRIRNAMQCLRATVPACHCAWGS